jgi:hypothetical protein
LEEKEMNEEKLREDAKFINFPHPKTGYRVFVVPQEDGTVRVYRAGAYVVMSDWDGDVVSPVLKNCDQVLAAGMGFKK